MILFPFGDYWWFYILFTLFVLGLLALDLGVFHKKEHAVSFKEAAAWSAVWVTLALIFNVLFYFYALWQLPHDARLMSIPGFDPAVAAWNSALEFLTGYVVEESLSVDNIFIFVLVFRYFAVPAKYQHRVLFYGIIGAIIFRAAFIGAGSWLIQFHWVPYLFGAFLIVTGVKMIFTDDTEIEPEKNFLIRVFKRFMPLSHERHGKKFFIREKGVWAATPLFIALLFLEFSDIVFAVDSVPAIFAVTNEPLIVFTSNIFAILGLRSMYFMLAGAVEKFHLIRFGLAVVLVFVGLKMVWLNNAFGGKFPIGWSLAIIIFSVGASIVLSLLFPRSGHDADSEA
ncbi:MAG TPA: TerC family protein [Pyrinomonadaceae bacterium]|nr:TerC family protein [Pyrinomonadaceae bacterium]